MDATDKSPTFRRNVIVYTVASVMGSMVHLAHLLWTHLLDQADYGRFAILEGVVFGFATATVTLAPQQYVLVYLHKKPRAALAGDLGGMLGLSFVVGGLSTLAIFALPDSFFVLGVEAIPRWAIAGVIVAATFSTARMMAQSINETQSQPTRAALWSDFVDGTRPFIAIALFFWLGWTWEARWGGLVLAQLGAGVAAVWILSRQGWLRRAPSLASLAEPLRFSLPMILAALAYVGYQSADRLYVALWGGVASAGRYEAAYRLALLVNTVNVITLKSFSPLFYSAYARGSREEAAKLLRRTSVQAAVWVAILVVLLPLIAVYTPILAESYRDSREVILSIPILAAGLGCLGISFLWQAPLLARGKTKTVSAIAVLSALVNLGVDALLIPSMGEVGAAWGTLIAFGFMLSVTMGVVWRRRATELN
ncbi:MAG: lipopolysaccharide biosynthesis protein [Polyangiales bacterium]